MELSLTHVTKRFKDKVAVKEVSLSLSYGVHALLGANGSGKTTLLRMICGIEKTSEGSITLNENNIKNNYSLFCTQLGYMPQHFGYYPNETVESFLDYMGVVKGIDKETRKKRINQLLKELNLEAQRKKKLKQLSGGMLRRVGIMQALLNEPKLLILDEPTAGLDPKERIVFRNLIASLAQDCCIILSTHIVSDIDTIADDILVMKEGNIILHDTKKALLKQMEGKVWEVQTTKSQGEQLLLHHIVSQSHTVGNETTLRIVSDMKPCDSAVAVESDLDDFYLYHFEGDESYVGTDL